MNKTFEAPKLVSVQWLRAVAAMMVVVHHALFFSNTMQGLPATAEREAFGFSAWWFGIHLFFVVSGFIMIRTASGFGETDAWRMFLAKRLIRIVPLYWLVMTPMVIGVLLWPRLLELPADKFQYLLSNYLFIPSMRTEGDLRPILGQGWTLNYEMFFYAVFAMTMLLPRAKAIITMTIGFATLAVLGRHLTASSPILFTWTDGIILEFIFGVYIGLAHQSGLRLSRPAAWALISAGVSLLVLDFHDLPTFLCAGVPAALIVCGAILGPQPNDSWFGRGLAGIGDASYSLYLTHVVVLRGVNSVWVAEFADTLPPMVFLMSALCVSVVTGLLVYRFVEGPMTLFLQQRLLEAQGQRGSPPLFARPIAAGRRLLEGATRLPSFITALMVAKHVDRGRAVDQTRKAAV